MTLFTYAQCTECGASTIGGRGHECVTPMDELHRHVFLWLRRLAIESRAKARR